MTTDRFEPHFINSSAGRIFALLRAPADARQCVLVVPPFGEEMNKCRRQFTETSRDLVVNGLAVLVIDLFGTGDSEGEFSNGEWSTWKADLEAAIEWAEMQNLCIESLVATRLGCALVAETLKSSDKHMRRSVFWQPVANGAQFMTQFLRLRIAASMMEDDNTETVEDLKRRLASGETLEIAGYPLTSSLWQGIEQVDLAGCLTQNLGSLGIFEVGRASSGELSPAGRKLVEAAAAHGLDVDGQRIAGEPFWTSTEIVTNEDLRRLTVEYLTSEIPA